MKKQEESKLKKNPGTIRWASYGFLCYIAWFAKRAVHMLTNCYLPVAESDNEPSTVLHWLTENGEKVQREIPRPPAVRNVNYNLYMGQLICLTNIAAMFKSSCKVEISCIPSFGSLLKLP